MKALWKKLFVFFYNIQDETPNVSPLSLTNFCHLTHSKSRHFSHFHPYFICIFILAWLINSILPASAICSRKEHVSACVFSKRFAFIEGTLKHTHLYNFLHKLRLKRWLYLYVSQVDGQRAYFFNLKNLSIQFFLSISYTF